MSQSATGAAAEPRVAVVTGGATGIGRAVCQALAAKGMRVGVVYNSSQAAARAVADGLPGAFVARADLGDPAQVEALVKQLQEITGRVDVLVNNAGYSRNAPIFNMKLDDYDAVMRYEIEIVRYQELAASGSAVAVGDATVAIDGDVIYTIKRAKVGIFRDIDYADYPWPGERSRGGRMQR